MQRVTLKIYVIEQQRYDGMLLYEWLIEEAKRQGVPGGSVFRSIEGYGRHTDIHKDTFFELSGTLPIQVELIMEQAQAQDFIDGLRQHKLNLFYVLYNVETGFL